MIGEAAYDDAAGAKRVTEQQLAAGADVVFGMGDGASFGMIEAIRRAQRQEAPSTGLVHRRDRRQEGRDYGDVLLTSVLFDYSGIYKQMIDDLAAGTFGKVYTMDVKNGGVRLLDLPTIVAQEVKDAVAKPQADIVDGSVDRFGDRRCRRDEGASSRSSFPAVSSSLMPHPLSCCARDRALGRSGG